MYYFKFVNVEIRDVLIELEREYKLAVKIYVKFVFCKEIIVFYVGIVCKIILY